MRESPIVNNNLLLVHTCCAVCLCYPNELLKSLGFSNIIFYFYNPNIFPIKEYERRKSELIEHAKKHSINLEVEENHSHIKNWYEDIKGFENELEKGKRCDICFNHRLRKTFEHAKNVKAKTVTTVMTVSPHKSSKNIELIGSKLSKEYEIDYLALDFKKQDGFKKTNIIANENSLYRQDYCGCECSMRVR